MSPHQLIGTRARTGDRMARSIREAFPEERFAAIELPPSDPERRLVRPALIGVASLLALLLAIGVIQ
jgi:hypothetical protein